MRSLTSPERFVKILSRDFNKMTIEKLAGIYVYCNDYHSGQWSRLYRLMCIIGKRLKLNDKAFDAIRNGENGPYDEWFEARIVYSRLVERGIQYRKPLRTLLETIIPFLWTCSKN